MANGDNSDMNRQVMYVMSGAAHCPYLVASLWTLRQHYQGPVVIHAWDDSFPMCSHMALDSRLQGTGGLEVFNTNPPDEILSWRKNRQFGHKIWLARESKADAVLYLDADTTIHGSLEVLFKGVERDCTLYLTQFNDWDMSGGIVQKRVRRTEPHLPANPYHTVIDNICGTDFPSVNGGIWAAKPTSPALSEWYEMTKACRRIFIADEACLHILAGRWKGTEMVQILRGGLYNMSARQKFWPSGTQPTDIRVMHYHGDSNCRPDKAPQGSEYWWLCWKSLWRQNIGNVQQWRKDISNKYFDAFIGAKMGEDE